MTNSKRMTVHLLIMTIALGALTIHLISAQVVEATSASTETTTEVSSVVDATSGQTGATDVTTALGSTGDQGAASSSDTSHTVSDSSTAPKDESTVTTSKVDISPGTGTATDGTSQSTVSGTATSPAVPVSTSKDTTTIEPSTAPTPPPGQCKCEHAPTVWEAHTALFLVIIIIGACCVALTSACCICMICYGRSPMDDDTCDCFGPRQHKLHPEKGQILMEQGTAEPHPIEVPNPIPDAEIIKDEAPMLERENPAVTPNGGGQHISKNEDDNGWVVPLDELSSAEKEKPEVENTRL